MPFPRVYKSDDVPGMWGFIGCDSDCYPTEQDACEASFNSVDTACPDCGNEDEVYGVAETGMIHCPLCANEY